VRRRLSDFLCIYIPDKEKGKEERKKERMDDDDDDDGNKKRLIIVMRDHEARSDCLM